MPYLGEIKRGYEIGWKTVYKVIWAACIICGKERWVQIRKREPEHNRCHSCGGKGINSGNANGQWKGDNICYTQLHRWVRKHFPKPETCEICQIAPAVEVSNKTGIYNRDFDNWQWVCRRCHMKFDGRMGNLIQFAKKRPDGKTIACDYCGKERLEEKTLELEDGTRICILCLAGEVEHVRGD